MIFTKPRRNLDLLAVNPIPVVLKFLNDILLDVYFSLGEHGVSIYKLLFDLGYLSVTASTLFSY